MRNSQVGDLLVASTEVDGTILNRGICLLVYEDDQTAIGLMLNRPFQMVPLITSAADAATLSQPQPQPNRLSSGLRRDPSAHAAAVREITDEHENADKAMPADTTTHQLEGFQAPAANPNVPKKQVVALVGAVDGPEAGKLLAGKSLYFGGPLSGPLVAVHGLAELAEAEAGDGIFVAAQREHLEALLHQDQPHPYRLIVGHLGWTQQQLTEEIAAGVWHRMPATPEILSTADEWLWPKLIRSATATSVSHWLGVPHVADAHLVN